MVGVRGVFPRLVWSRDEGANHETHSLADLGLKLGIDAVSLADRIRFAAELVHQGWNLGVDGGDAGLDLHQCVGQHHEPAGQGVLDLQIVGRVACQRLDLPENELFERLCDRV